MPPKNLTCESREEVQITFLIESISIKCDHLPKVLLFRSYKVPIPVENNGKNYNFLTKNFGTTFSLFFKENVCHVNLVWPLEIQSTKKVNLWEAQNEISTKFYRFQSKVYKTILILLCTRMRTCQSKFLYYFIIKCLLK